MKVLAALAVVALSATYVLSQESTTANPGVQPGGFCNGLLLTCDTHGNTVHCIKKTRNDTIGGETCEEGATVDLGVCACQRNCKTDGTFEDLAEWDKDRLKCVGLVGKACSALLPDCTAHATCNLLGSVCACQNGYVPDASGLRCVAA